MAENTIRIDGTVPTSSVGTSNVNVTNASIPVTDSGGSLTVDGTVAISNTSLATYGVGNPSFAGTYVFSTSEQTGVVAANNFLTLFNPVGSGKTLVYGGTFISQFIVADTATTVVSMRGYRITTATGGTLQATSAIAKFVSTYPTQVAEVRIGNPSVTLGASMFNSPPYVGAGKGSIPVVHSVLAPPGAGPFTFAPGEGIVLRTEAGDVDQRWNLSVVWAEM